MLVSCNVLELVLPFHELLRQDRVCSILCCYFLALSELREGETGPCGPFGY